MGLERAGNTKGKMNEEIKNFENLENALIFQAEKNIAPESGRETVINDSFFVFLKPNCYYEDGVAQTDFVAYNIPMENLNLSPELVHKLNVCPTSLMKDFQTLESQAYDIKSLSEHGIMES